MVQVEFRSVVSTSKDLQFSVEVSQKIVFFLLSVGFTFVFDRL